MRRIWPLVTILLLAISLPARGAGPPLTIGVSLSLTGRYQTMGRMQQRGFSLWVRDVNRWGGLLGRKVRLLLKDDASNPAKAARIYRRLIEKKRVSLLFGPYSSAITEAVLPVVERHHYPLLVSGASADRLWRKGYRYAFGVYTPASKYAVGFLELLVKHGLQRLAILSADDSFSRSLSQSVLEWAGRLRLEVVFLETFRKGSKKLAPLVRRARRAGTQVLLVCGHLEESLNILDALAAISWKPRALYASVGPATGQFHRLAGARAEGVFSSSLWEPQVGCNFPRGKRFIQEFRRTYHMSPSYHAAAAYAAGMILEAALKGATRLDRERLRDTLATMDTMTLIGRYGVDRHGRQIRHFPLIIQWQDGKKQIVWPEGLRTAQARFD